ncbi:MAG TPA: 50S ribosomal protein L23 [Polyangiaceae bacterium]|jgi:large subunit ribosomal protein L23|nr:50S ribosomal protein L23 [Polyangiaceae bacterium]
MKRTAQQIILRPVALTEKATRLKANHNQVVFEVARDANKIQIRHALEQLFNVKVERVNTLIQRGKVKNVGRKELKRPNWKKAIVTLRSGDQIEFFSEAQE